MLALSKRKTHKISRSDNWNGFKNQAEKTLKLDANINNKQVKFEIKHTMLFTLASPQIKCMHASHSVRSTSLLPHELQPTRLLCLRDSPGKNTGVGCPFLLQCMKVKSESEVSQSYPTLSDPTDCSPPGSSIHGSFQARVLEWGAIWLLIFLPAILLLAWASSS